MRGMALEMSNYSIGVKLRKKRWLGVQREKNVNQSYGQHAMTLL
jgi:hypothetical protein